MNKRICIVLMLVALQVVSYGQVRLPRLISDGMVLQRDQVVQVWGWAAANEPVTLSFKKQTFKTKADSQGKWMLKLPAQKAGGPYEMTFTASNTTQVKDILFGDVWVCSGQSNMELPVSRLLEAYPTLATDAKQPMIRQFIVPDTYNFVQAEADVKSGQWKPATYPDILSFSGVAYFFAMEIYQKYGVPIGLINSALGGSPAEAWISEESLKTFPTYYGEAQKFRDNQLITSIENQGQRVSSLWYSLLNQTDQGLLNGWKEASFQDTSWPTMKVPGYWADTPLGKVNGVVWFRKEIDIPASLTQKAARMILGRIVDADSVFVNGTFVGSTGYQYPPRWYTIPAGVLKAGKNTIAVRVINNSGNGGFVLDKPYVIRVDNQTLDLKGDWKYKLGAPMAPLPGQPVIRWKPVGLYNAMISPLINYRIKGVLWYQGESNTKDPSDYTQLMNTLITDWRKQWKQGDFPFIYVQLANFMETRTIPVESSWATLRQAQMESLSVPKTGMAVAIDLGEWNDIHPVNKKDVGHRLALQAQKLAYGNKNVVASGPVYQSMQVSGNKVILTFDSVGSGLTTTNGKPLQHIAIAGADQKFVWANAEIKGNQLVVWQDSISVPVVVRYAWADNPEGANLGNKEGLPASPFEARKK